jgi:hypothetical protein
MSRYSRRALAYAMPVAMLLLIPTITYSQEIAYTESGKKIKLNPDGTWILIGTDTATSNNREAVEFLIEKSTTPITVRTTGELKIGPTDSYKFPEGKFVAVSIDMGTKYIRAYFDKNSQDGKRLIEALADGKSHKLVLEIRYRSKSEQDAVYKSVYGNQYRPGVIEYDNEAVLITKVVNIGTWHGGE